MQEPHGGGGGLPVPDHYGVGRGAECGGDGGLESGLDRDHGRQGSQNAGGEDPGGEFPGGRAEHVLGAVLAVQPELEGVAAGLEGAAFPLVLALGRFKLSDLGEDGVQVRAGGLVVGVERFLAVLDAGRLRFQGSELTVRLPAAFLAGLLRFAEASEFGLGGLDAGPCRPDLPGELGQAFAPVRGGPEQGREALVLGGGGLFGVLFCGGRGVQRLRPVQDLPFQPGLLVADAGGLLLQLVRIPAGVRNRVGGAEQAAAFLGERAEGTEPFASRGE